jgi:hypothetical protein
MATTCCKTLPAAAEAEPKIGLDNKADTGDVHFAVGQMDRAGIEPAT